MSFWRAAMPAGMLLRSAWSASHIAGPHASLTLDAYKVSSGNHLAAPISLERFIDYGLWYQRTAVPDVDRRTVSSIEPHAGKFQIRLEDGSDFLASRVVIAGGISAFAARPAAFEHIPRALATHTSEAQDLSQFANSRVIVVGGGQSGVQFPQRAQRQAELGDLAGGRAVGVAIVDLGIRPERQDDLVDGRRDLIAVGPLQRVGRLQVGAVRMSNNFDLSPLAASTGRAQMFRHRPQRSGLDS